MCYGESSSLCIWGSFWLPYGIRNSVYVGSCTIVKVTDCLRTSFWLPDDGSSSVSIGCWLCYGKHSSLCIGVSFSLSYGINSSISVGVGC